MFSSITPVNTSLSQAINQRINAFINSSNKEKIMKATTKGMDIQNKLTAYTIPCTYKLAK